MMKPTLKLLTLSLLIGAFTTSCVSSKKYNELLEAKEATDKALAETQEMIQTLKEENQSLEDAKADLMSDIEDIKADLNSTKAEIAEVKKMVEMKDAELNRIKGEIKSAFAFVDQEGMDIRQEGDMFYISMDEKLLFPTASAYVNKSGRNILDSMAELLNNNKNMKVLVEGHTDKRPIATARYPSNWELSAARASSVVRHLIKKGIEADRLIAAGKAATDPKKGEGVTMKDNRRVEFAIMPNVDDLYMMVNKG